jgi:hypothetical protein
MPGIFVLPKGIEGTLTDARLAILGDKANDQQKTSFTSGFTRIFAPGVTIEYLGEGAFKLSGDYHLLEEVFYGQSTISFSKLKELLNVNVADFTMRTGASFALLLRVLTEHGARVCEDSGAVRDIKECVAVLYSRRTIDGKPVNIDALWRLVKENSRFFDNARDVLLAFHQ